MQFCFKGSLVSGVPYIPSHALLVWSKWQIVALVIQESPSGLSALNLCRPHICNDQLWLGSPCCPGLGVPVGILAELLLVGQAPLCVLYHFKNNMPSFPRATYLVTLKVQDKRGHIPVACEVTGNLAWKINMALWGGDSFLS